MSTNKELESLTQCFMGLDTKWKLSALKRLLGGKQAVSGCKVAAPKSADERHEALLVCIKCCSAREIEIIEFLLKRDKITYNAQNRFMGILPIFISLIAVIATMFSPVIEAAIANNDAENLAKLILTLMFSSIFVVVAFVGVHSWVEKGLKTTNYLLELVERHGKKEENA